MNHSQNIHIFKTNISDHEQKTAVLSILESLAEVTEASIDLEDCDKVLRIVTSSGITSIQNLLTNHGILCSELP